MSCFTGKTHTLVGAFDGANVKTGMIPRAVTQVLHHLSIVPQQKYRVFVSYCALTADKTAMVHDLLAPGSTPTSIRDTGVQRSRLAQVQITNPPEVIEVRVLQLPPQSIRRILTHELLSSPISPALRAELGNRCSHCDAKVPSKALHTCP